MTRMFERISKRERPMGRSASPFLPKQAPRLLLNRVKKIYRMSYYIQVGMKNKKYFLAIFPFITIFLGYGAGDGERAREGRRCKSKEGKGRTEHENGNLRFDVDRDFFSFLERNVAIFGGVREDHFEKAVTLEGA